MDSVSVPGIDLPAIGSEIAGKYRVENILGQGGMGAVFAARNGLTGKRVAIKWLLPHLSSPGSRERLLREARIASSIEHPNVVDIYDVGEHEGGLFLVMEFLRGRTLADVLAERGRLSPEELIPVIVPAMRGVQAAHAAGVVHRDLKAENIFLSELDGAIVPKVLDFGVSKSIDALGEQPTSLTRTGALVGTPHYMALEQVDGSGAIDQRTDVYGFGVLIYRGLTGYFPFDGSSIGEVILKVGTIVPTAPRSLRPDIPEELEQVILKALSRDRAERFQSLADFGHALSPFAPPTYTTLDGTPRYSVSGALRGNSESMAGQRSIRSIVRDAQGASTGGLSTGGGATRTPSRALWIAAILVFGGVASVAAWASTRANPEPAAQVVETRAPVSAAPARGGLHVGERNAPPALPVPGESAATAIEPAAIEPTAEPGSAAPPAAKASVAHEPSTLDAPIPAGPSVTAQKKRVALKSARLPGGPTVIPGDRTKGLSSDDF